MGKVEARFSTMDWSVPYVIYRVTDEGKIDEVFHASDLKMAKYWLGYIAQPGDVLCKTPIHPKHSRKSQYAEYWSHKEASGSATQNEAEWRKLVEHRNFDGVFPAEQLREPT
jgi:hypothetical protein